MVTETTSGLPQCVCRNPDCGYTWVPRTPRPKRCPSCQSRRWAAPLALEPRSPQLRNEAGRFVAR